MKNKSKINRKNKVANHYQLLLEKKKRLSNNKDLLQLAVYGTLDPLSKRYGALSISKKILKKHPTDEGYFKTVYVISEYGKRLLKNRFETN